MSVLVRAPQRGKKTKKPLTHSDIMSEGRAALLIDPKQWEKGRDGTPLLRLALIRQGGWRRCKPRGVLQVHYYAALPHQTSDVLYF
ncbi:hypothetical protein CSC82_14775 [Rhodobacteraceae bacterium 4F10]|nr:hypothetical protein CSC82_14775 [Rhodobacteraceae bacterium 4F10]